MSFNTAQGFLRCPRSRDLTAVSTFRDSYAHVSIYGYSDMIVVREGVGTPAFARLAIFY